MMLVWFLLAVGLLVFIHEMGHYLAARSVGVHVERFSIGFGRVLVRLRDRRGCEWALSTLPLGGYVKLNIDQCSLGARAWVVAAGPLANFLFAIAAYAFLAALPREEPRAILAAPALESPAARAGLRAGDEVLAVNERPVAHYQALRWALLKEAVAQGDLNVSLTVQSRGASPRTVTLQVRRDPSKPDAGPEETLQRAGLQLQSMAVRITQVLVGSPAQQAGIQEGQVILALNGLALEQPATLIQAVRQAGAEPLILDLISVSKPDGPGQRMEEVPGSARRVALLPAAGPDGQVRVGLGLAPVVQTVRVEQGVAEAVVEGFARTFDMASLSLTALGRMLTGDLSWRQLSGPATIADAAGQSADRGSLAFFGFLALVSVSIGILNLLPVPMLDGGHLLYYAIEFVRGRPLSEGAQRLGQQLGLAAILSLTGLALASDLLRYFGT
ncbi:MAG: RIP metalloprotease RseP [Burkholderiaceae bacterium]